MRILIAHNEYQQPGGEDTVAAAEARLLESYGHSVIRYRRHNDELNRRGTLRIAAAGLETVWSQRSARELRTLIRNEQPDVAHFHNTFPLISPAAYAACAGAGVPVVQTLHNYRLLCPSAILFREGRTCTECLGRTPAWPGVAHACYRNNRAATTAVATMLATHRILGTWSEKVDVYVALSEFARRIFIQGGLPAERIVVKPNFVQHTPAAADEPGDYVLFIGRFCEEKGVRTLLDAWRKLKQPIPLRIAGDGPLREEMAETIHRYGLSHVTLTERADSEEIKRLLRGSRFLVFPSLWFEGFPLSIAEAMATGRAVIVSRLGSMMEIIEDGSTGLHFAAGDALDLARKVEWAWNDQDGIRRLGRNARDQFERTYTAERNYRTLMSIYERAASTRRVPLWQRRTGQSPRSRSNERRTPDMESRVSIGGDRHDSSPSTARHLKKLPTAKSTDTFRVLGVSVNAIQISDVVARVGDWIERKERGRFVAATGMHGVMEAFHDSTFRKVLNHCDLVVPDGAPLVWLARLNRRSVTRRVYGPELMLALCDRGREKGVRHFFFGGEPGVPEQLARALMDRFPGLVVAGTYSPPFRPLTPQEDEEVIARINAAAPDVVWVGISTPKQERWMFTHRHRLNAPVLVGVGAAFDIHSGRRKQAPAWMREHGLEWFYRLLQEPRRLWRRYVVLGTEFVFWVTLDLLGLRRFE